MSQKNDNSDASSLREKSQKRKHADVESRSGSCEYEVEKILECRLSKGGRCLKYLVKWAGYPDSDNSWEREANVQGCKEMVLDYHRAHGSDQLLKYSMFRPNQRSVTTKPFGFKVADKIDTEFVHNLGQKFSRRHWKIKKIGKGHYTIKYRERELARQRDSISTSDSSDLMDTGEKTKNEGESSSPGPKLDMAIRTWETKLNEICIAAGEAPLVLENKVGDDPTLPFGSFEYVTALKIGNGITVPAEPVVGCECRGGLCLVDSQNCCAAQMHAQFAYGRNGKLRLEVGRPIYECNSLCPCGDDCVNRVVQKGRKTPLVIFKTSDGRGWGVKAATKLEKNTFVSEYVGELITVKDAEERDDDSYMFNMDFADDTAEFVIDAKYYGNVTRFINHSCDPNLTIFAAWVNHYEPGLPRLAFFTNRVIELGEELTFDYYRAHGKRDTNQTDVSRETVNRQQRDTLVSCKCRTRKCRGHKFGIAR